MGPITLFDKSFLQSLTVDESFWFDHFFLCNICPLFYVETLADLEKAPRDGRKPEDEVRIIADKFPDNGAPSVHHSRIIRSNLYGNPIPMDGRILKADGRNVSVPGKKGVVFEASPEADAFLRWQDENFLDVERLYAKQWREDIQNVDLAEATRALKGWGIEPRKCKTLEQAAKVAQNFAPTVEGIGGLRLLFLLLNVPDEFRQRIIDAWHSFKQPKLGDHAPYAEFVLSIEVFFNLSR